MVTGNVLRHCYYEKQFAAIFLCISVDAMYRFLYLFQFWEKYNCIIFSLSSSIPDRFSIFLLEV